MRNWLGLVLLLAAVTVTLSAEQRRLSSEDQRRFDSYYAHWQDARQHNDRDEIISMEQRMLDIYQHYGIPADTPYRRVASEAAREDDRDRDRDRSWDRDRDYDRDRWRGKLSADDQGRFDSYYSRWLEYRRASNRDDIVSMEKRMLDLYQQNGIPSNIHYWRVATAGRPDDDPDRGWDRNTWHNKLIPRDQARFDSYFSRWQQFRRDNNQAEAASMEQRMQDIYPYYGIPFYVPFWRVASNGIPDDRDDEWNRNPWRGRLSADDQRRFDSYYTRWQQYRRENNRDEIGSMEKRMWDVMDHYSIPHSVAFAQIASQSE